MNMQRVRTRTTARTQVMSRAKLCADTAHRFFRINEAFGTNEGYWHERIDLAIKTQFVEEFMTVIHGKGGDDDVIGGVALKFDWETHEALCVAMGDDVDTSELEEGTTFDSIQNALNAVQQYLRDVHETGLVDHLSTWIVYAPKAIEEYGIERVREVLNTQKSPEEHARTAKRFASISKAMDEGDWQSGTPDHLKETSLMGFKRKE